MARKFRQFANAVFTRRSDAEKFTKAQRFLADQAGMRGLKIKIVKSKNNPRLTGVKSAKNMFRVLHN